MCFPDFPFDSSLLSFVHHSDVLHYLEQYTEHYQLYQYIQFYTQVKRVTPLYSAPTNHMNHRSGYINNLLSTRWEVDIKYVHSHTVKKEYFNTLYNLMMETQSKRKLIVLFCVLDTSTSFHF